MTGSKIHNICLYGIEDTGKTTILNQLAKRLNESLYNNSDKSGDNLLNIKNFSIRRILINNSDDYYYVFDFATECKSYKILINTAGDAIANFENLKNSFYENRNYDLLFFCERIGNQTQQTSEKDSDADSADKDASDDFINELIKTKKLRIQKKLDDLNKGKISDCNNSLIKENETQVYKIEKVIEEKLEGKYDDIVNKLFKHIQDLFK